MKTYEAVFNEENKGVYGISLVENPAMEGNFIALSQTKVQLQTVDEEQRILMGLVLEPDKPIYRNQDGEEFNIIFNSETIKDLSHNFFKKGFQKNSTIEHDNSIDGVTFVESWIVEDSKIDKSANFGFSYPKGSWIATMKVDSDEIWNDYVKTGKVLGFSVDAFVTLKEIKLNSNKMAEEKKDSMLSEITNAIKDGFVAFKEMAQPAKVELGSIATSEGVALMYEGEMLEVGGAVWIEGEGGERIGAPIGEHALEDGKVLVVAEEGVVAEVKEAVAEQEAPAELDEVPSNPTNVTEEIKSAIKSVLIKYSEDFDKKLEDFKTEFSELKKENEEMKEKLVEFGKQPVAKPVKGAPTQSREKGLVNFLNSRA